MPKLALADQIKALEANTRAAQAGNSMALDNRRFSLDQAKAFNENQMKWIELKMKWNLHAQEVIKKQIENAKSFLELQQMRFAFQQFIIQQRILKNDIRKQKIRIKANERHVSNAIKIFQGGDINPSMLSQAWKSFGRLGLTSRVIFPETDGSCFLRIKHHAMASRERTAPMAIYQLAAHCRRNRLMVDPVSPEFSFILQVWEELTAAAQLQLADLITNLDSMNDHLQALHSQQWAKAGLV